MKKEVKNRPVCTVDGTSRSTCNLKYASFKKRPRNFFVLFCSFQTSQQKFLQVLGFLDNKRSLKTHSSSLCTKQQQPLRRTRCNYLFVCAYSFFYLTPIFSPLPSQVTGRPSYNDFGDGKSSASKTCFASQGLFPASCAVDRASIQRARTHMFHSQKFTLLCLRKHKFILNGMTVG